MGYNTTITFNNDAAHEFENNKERLVEIIIDATRRMKEGSKFYSIGNYANYIKAQTPRHASDTTIYVHYSGCVTEVDPLSQDFKTLLINNPDYANNLVKFLEKQVKELKGQIKKLGLDREKS